MCIPLDMDVAVIFDALQLFLACHRPYVPCVSGSDVDMLVIHSSPVRDSEVSASVSCVPNHVFCVLFIKHGDDSDSP